MVLEMLLPSAAADVPAEKRVLVADDDDGGRCLYRRREKETCD